MAGRINAGGNYKPPTEQEKKSAEDQANWWTGENSILGKWGRDLSGETDRRAQEQARKDAEDAAAKAQAWNEAQTAKRLAELGVTAEEYQAAQMGPTAYEQITEDPRWKESQIAALNQLSGWSTGGLTATDAAALDLANRKVAQQEIAARDAAEANQRARGFAPSGAGAVLGAQAARAAAANRMADQGTQTLGMLQNRQMTATGQMGSLGGQVRGQEYGMASDKARARDAVNQFNVAALNQAAGFNANARQNLKSNRAGMAGTAYSNPMSFYQGPASNPTQDKAWGTLGGIAELGAKGGLMLATGGAAAPAIMGYDSIKGSMPKTPYKDPYKNYNVNNGGLLA